MASNNETDMQAKAQGENEDASTAQSKAQETNESQADEEVLELEICEDDIVRYIKNESGEEVGFVVLEGGSEVEYMYAEGEEGMHAQDEQSSVSSEKSGSKKSKSGTTVSYKDIQQTTDDVNAIYKDGVKVASELKEAYADIQKALDFKSLLK